MSDSIKMAEVDDYLMHFGVKGMKWGIRKDRSTGSGDYSAQKSAGHRAANAVLGDKTFWKRTGIITGATVTSAVGALYAPGLLPASLLESIGHNSWTKATGGGFGGGIPAIRVGDKVYYGKEAWRVGGKITTTIYAEGLIAATAVGALAVNAGTNLARAVRGTPKLSDKDAERVGKRFWETQNRGRDRVNKTIKPGNIQHSAVPSFLRHADMTLQDVWDSLTPNQQDCAALIIAADNTVNGDTIVYDNVTLSQCYNTFTEIQKSLLDILVAGADDAIEHSDRIGRFLAHHDSVKVSQI